MSAAALAIIRGGSSPITAASIASPAQLEQIRLSVTETQSMLVAWYCRDNGSSPNMTAPAGNIDGTTTWASVFRAIRSVCTLRQHNAYYAPWVYHHSVAGEDPRHDFNGKGYTEQTKYVAFDFAHGLTSKHSYRDAEITRAPTLSDAEAAAISANSSVAIVRARAAAATTSTNFVDILGGRVTAGPTPRLALPPSAGN